MLEIGTKAPDFALEDQNGTLHTLQDMKGKRFILYFYSKDNTSGCTKQACAYGENYPAFLDKGVEVIGVSKDTAASHAKFAQKFNLPFTLLADPEKKVLEAYDVWTEKTMYGKKVMGVVRTTYLIDEEGIIIDARTKVKADQDAAVMLERI